MAENKISYLSRTYDDYKKAILDITQKYYGDVYDNFNDASVGAWLVDILADVADSLSYNIDRTYQETSIESANETESVKSIARTMGLNIPGKKAAICEVELYCELPLNPQESDYAGDLSAADENYAPVVKRGTLFSTGSQTFELMEDVDFSEQFDDNGMSNRKIYPTRDANGNIVGYVYGKLAVAVAGQSKIYKKVITNADIKPFMTVEIKDSDAVSIESIIVKDGTSLTTDPYIDEFYVDRESYDGVDGKKVQRFFEVENLTEQYRFGYETFDADDNGYYTPKWETVEEIVTENGETIPLRTVVKGDWKRFKNKFVTEFTDSGSIKITFGKGIRNEYGDIPSDAREFTKYMMCRMEANDYMGVLPEAGKTMYVLYRTGGGESSNIAKNTLTNIDYKHVLLGGNCNDSADAAKKRSVLDSLRVTNTTPSYGGKDAPTDEELKYLVKYNNSAQGRCVTLHDYQSAIMRIPPKYGCPFRCGVIEENNKVVIYVLGLDYLGRLQSLLAETVAENMKNYLSNYKMINDFVEIRSGKVINLAFDVEIFVDKAYDKSEVVKRVIDLVYDYMDIRRHQMGEDIFIGDLEKEISKLDGVQNFIKLSVRNQVGSENGYSDSEITQEIVKPDECSIGNEATEYENEVDLKASDKVLYTDANSMFEIKYKDKDIKVTVKQRQ